MKDDLQFGVCLFILACIGGTVAWCLMVGLALLFGA